MSDHSKTLVPLESWAFHSPEIRYNGDLIDIGLLAEALIYYDQILINCTNPRQFSELLSWFIRQGEYETLLTLLVEETLAVYHYSFYTLAAYQAHKNTYVLINITDEKLQQPRHFLDEFLYNTDVYGCFDDDYDRHRLLEVLEDRVIEVKADGFGGIVEDAKQDWCSHAKLSYTIGALLDEVYPMLKLGMPPTEIPVQIQQVGDELHTVTFGIDFSDLSSKLGQGLNFHRGTILTAFAQCNRLLQSAANQNCDLYLGSPMSSLAGGKLYQCGQATDNTPSAIISSLQAEVEFPYIRQLVNDSIIDLREILRIRGNARKFRDWLQEESERDRNAIIAYHEEAARALGYTRGTRSALKLFGVLGAGAVGGAIGGVVGGLIGSGLGSFVTDLASKLSADWRPVVFGNWLRDRMTRITDQP